MAIAKTESKRRLNPYVYIVIMILFYMCYGNCQYKISPVLAASSIGYAGGYVVYAVLSLVPLVCMVTLKGLK